VAGWELERRGQSISRQLEYFGGAGAGMQALRKTVMCGRLCDRYVARESCSTGVWYRGASVEEMIGRGCFGG
jgi:hypothetical protein